jgi:hypothetical protein
MVVQKTQYGSIIGCPECLIATTFLPHPLAFKPAFKSTKQKTNTQAKQNRECAMARTGLNYLPRQNPCAQCGKPIAMPEWVESNGGRACYLWHCWACDYRFEAIAFFDEPAERQIAA